MCSYVSLLSLTAFPLLLRYLVEYKSHGTKITMNCQKASASTGVKNLDLNSVYSEYLLRRLPLLLVEWVKPFFFTGDSFSVFLAPPIGQKVMSGTSETGLKKSFHSKQGDKNH